MENDEANKLTEAIARANSHKTTQQTLELLEANKYFQKDTADMRIKWINVIEEFNKYYQETIRKSEEKAYSKVRLPETIEPKNARHWIEELLNAKKNLSEEDQKEIAMSEEKMILALANRDFTNDIIEVCKKYKLSPVEIWLPQIRTYIALGQLPPPDLFLLAGLKDYLTKEEIINSPQDLNFIPSIKTNPATGEKTLSVDFLDNTTIKEDLKKHGGIIEKIQKLLRREKGVKRFYPIKNIPVLKELAELDKEESETYFDPFTGKQITEKMTYVDKALKIYPDVPFDAKEEKKAGNKLNQLNHQNKKRSL